MAGCGTCPDQCSCVVTNQCGDQYPGSGSADTPIVIPERYDYPWAGSSSDGSITIVPDDVRNPGDCSDADGHAPDLVVNFCNVLNPDEYEDGDLLVVRDEDGDCRPRRLRDPLPDEVLSRDPATGRAAWVGNVASFGGDIPYGVPLEFWGNEAAVPGGYALCDFSLVDIVDNPNLFAAIAFNASGGVDPGGGQFHLPDKRGVATAGRDDMGGTPRGLVTDAGADTLGTVLGGETTTLLGANLPPHTHPLAIVAGGTGISVTAAPSAVSITPAGTGVSVVANGNHTHIPSAGRSFVTAEDATLTQVRMAREAGAAAPNRVDVVVDTNDGNADYGQKNNQTTNNPGDHGHGVSDPGHNHAVTNSNHGHPISDPGHGHTGTANANAGHTSTPFSRLQPTVFVNYIIRLG